MSCYLMTTSVLLSANLFARTFGGSSAETYSFVTQSADGGYAVTGITTSFGTGYRLALLKLTPSGDLEWAKAYGNAMDPMSIITTADGGYLIVGVRAVNDPYYGTVHYIGVIKLTSSGGVEWAKAYGGGYNDFAYTKAAPATDGGYFISGWSESFTSNHKPDFIVMKLTSSGNVQWARVAGGYSTLEQLTMITATTDGGCAMVGRTGSSGVYDLAVMKFTSSGGLEWAKSLATSRWDEAWSIIQTTDGGYAIAGLDGDYFVFKLTSSGNIEWAKAYGGSGGDWGLSMVQTSDGGYILGGYTNSFGAGNTDFLVIKLNSSGGVEWARTLGGSQPDECRSIIQASDGSYVVSGYTYSFGAGVPDFLIAKLGHDGSYPGCWVECTPTVTDLSVTIGATYTPSPLSLSGSDFSVSVLDITPTVTDPCTPLYEDIEEGLGKGFDFRATGKGVYLFMPNSAQVSLTLYDAQGRLVQRLYDGVLSQGGHTFSLKLEAKGVYMAVLRYQGGMKSLKIVR